MSSLDSRAGAAAVFLVAALAMTLPGLGSHGLVRMEGMIAAIASDMLASGEFAVPRLYGEIYAYKPPLLYWLVAGAFQLTGSTAEWVIRLPAAVSGMVMGLVTLLFVGGISGARIGFFAAAAAFSNALFLQKLRIAEFDAPLAACLGVAIAAACYALARDEGGDWAWCICYPALAAAFLTKGMPAMMIFVPGLIGAAFLNGRARALLRWPHVLGILLFAVVAGGWIAAAHAAAGWELFVQPLEEARLRGAEWSLPAVGLTLAKPALIWAYFLPWSVALFWSRPPVDSNTTSDRLTRGAWGFLIAGTLAFMAVPTHESRYYLPLAVPLGIVCAAGLERMTASSRVAARALPAGLAGAIGLAVLALGLLPASPVAAIDARSLLTLLGAGSMAVTIVLARGGGPPWRVTALVSVALCFWGAETFAFAPGRSASRDQYPAAVELLPSIADEEALWVPSPAGLAGNYSALLYRLDKPVRTFGVAGPPPGALCLIPDADLPRIDRELLDRLDPIASASGPRRIYRLYRASG